MILLDGARVTSPNRMSWLRTCWTPLGTSQDSQETNLNGAMSRHWKWATAGGSRNSCQYSEVESSSLTPRHALWQLGAKKKIVVSILWLSGRYHCWMLLQRVVCDGGSGVTTNFTDWKWCLQHQKNCSFAVWVYAGIVSSSDIARFCLYVKIIMLILKHVLSPGNLECEKSFTGRPSKNHKPYRLQFQSFIRSLRAASGGWAPKRWRLSVQLSRLCLGCGTRSDETFLFTSTPRQIRPLKCSHSVYNWFYQLMSCQ